LIIFASRRCRYDDASHATYAERFDDADAAAAATCHTIFISLRYAATAISPLIGSYAIIACAYAIDATMPRHYCFHIICLLPFHCLPMPRVIVTG